MVFLALFARDGRYQMVTSAFSLALLAVFATRWTSVARSSPGPLFLFLGWAAASASWSTFLTDSVAQVANLGIWTVLGLLLGTSGSVRTFCQIWGRAAKLSLALAVLSSLSYAAGTGGDGIYNSKNHLGFAAACSLIPLIALYWPQRKVVVAGAVAAALFAAIMANSQTGVTLAVAIPMLFVGARIVSRLRWSALSAAGVVLMAGIGGVGIVTFQAMVERLTGLLGRDSRLSGRDEIWDAVGVGIRERPIFGTGLGGVWTRPAEEPTLSVLLELPVYLRKATVYAHNGFLDVTLQLGLIGLVLIVAVVGVALVRSFRKLPGSTGLVSAAPFVATVVYVIANTTETRLYNDQAWVVLVAALVIPLAARSDDGAPLATPKSEVRPWLMARDERTTQDAVR